MPGRVSQSGWVPTTMRCEMEWGTQILRSVTERGGAATIVPSETKGWSSNHKEMVSVAW
jgi:hypothetical protein